MAYVSRAVLLLLLASLLAGAWTIDRGDWGRRLVGDESTYLMAAESLARDGDLLYQRRDFDRFVAVWGEPPEGLILQSGDEGAHITFGKPFFYPLYLAPFIRVSPGRGAFVANVLLLALAAWATGRILSRRLGPVAYLWVSVFLFASVAFAYAYWAQPDLFLMALSALGLAAVFRGCEPVEGSSAPRLSIPLWALGGALLGAVAFSRPFYATLLAAALAFPPRRARLRAAVALVTGALLVSLFAAAVHWRLGGSWSAYVGQRRAFYTRTGFPEVDFPADRWGEVMDELGNSAWIEARALRPLAVAEPRLWAWNGIYFFVGRHVGILPYFLPLVLGLLAARWDRRGWALVLAAVVAATAFLLFRPFNFYGGGAALANRYFLPLYPAFWFLVQRRRSPGWLLAAALLAAPLLWPLWQSPTGDPLTGPQPYRYVSAAAARLLPFEASQSHLKPGGRPDLRHRGLWIRFLTADLASGDRDRWLFMKGGGRSELLIGAHQELPLLEIVARRMGESSLRLGGAEVLEEENLPRGRWRGLVRPDLYARHAMWWSQEPAYLYLLELQAEPLRSGLVTFRVSPLPGDGP